jgi:hypothetical protein
MGDASDAAMYKRLRDDEDLPDDQEEDDECDDREQIRTRRT